MILARTEGYARAVDDIDALATELVARRSLDPADAYNVGCAYALASAAADRDLRQERGVTVTDKITVANVGNVAESVTLAATSSIGLTVSALSPVSLQPGQSTTETITLTPDAATPLNSTLQAIITATFGPAGSPQT